MFILISRSMYEGKHAPSFREYLLSICLWLCTKHCEMRNGVKYLASAHSQVRGKGESVVVRDTDSDGWDVF